MSTLDFVVMSVFAILMVLIGLVFTVQSSKSSKSFFEAGGQTPWWINGLSLFISYFSAATFVVWGSIAYRYGLIANSIQFTMCVSGFVTALFIAGRWKRTGAATAAEYLGKRFGRAAKQYYSYMVLLYSLVSTAAVLYAVGKIVYVATPFSLEACITVIGITIIIYTTGGGLWGVLATDVVQFVILSAAVIIIIPLALHEVGGMQNFLSHAPARFFEPVNKEYSIGFMLAFFIYQVVYIAGNWSYVQRYTSVSSTRNAKKVAYLFAGLYLVAPVIWMLPPMIYRVINPSLAGTDAEGAYMMLCQKVLPAGLIGLVLSGMIAATASKANTTINTAAIIFAQDIYRDIFFKQASEKRTILVARLFTVLFGAGTIGLAILVPAAGGIVEVVLSTAAIAGGSLFGPVIYSLFSKRQTSFSLITVSIVSLLVSLFFKVLAPSLLGITLSRTLETTLGVGFPLVLLLAFEYYAYLKQIHIPYYQELETLRDSNALEAQKQNIFGVRVIALSTGFVGLGITILGGIAENGRIAMMVGIAIILIACWVLLRQQKAAKARLAAAVVLLLCSLSGLTQEKMYLRGDETISFKWRYGYSEFPFPEGSKAAQEDAQRGKFGWYDGSLWTQRYNSWDGQSLQGVPLLFRGGSPYAREVKCTSEIVPFSLSGSPVSFLIPVSCTIGSEEDLAFALRVKGNGEETIVCKLKPKASTAFTAGMFKVNFITLTLNPSQGSKPLVNFTGLLHIRVYPSLLVYNERMEFSFSSVTHHMDVESSMVIGSLYQDVSNQDPYALSGRIPADSFTLAAEQHDRQLRSWRQNAIAMSEQLQGRGRVEVSLKQPVRPRDPGELRVMAYSGNPVKDFQYGEPSDQMRGMAASVTKALGRHFALFRYQHHYLPWKLDKPDELDSTQLPYLRKWLELANEYADSVMLDLQISPIIKMYREVTRAGQLALPAKGIPGAEWEKIVRGYLTTLKFAKAVCPHLRIVQMPYELDNMSNAAVHADAHYHFFQAIYQAVAQFNMGRPAADRLRIAGLGSNNPNSRWDFIKGFLKRYQHDTNPEKRLDYITWHTYLFPGNYPAMVKGFNDSLKAILAAYQLPRIPVIVDEMGLAEPSTIDDLSELRGAMKKEAAMASFTAALQDYYDREEGSFIPVSGAGWHYALLTYGKQNLLSPYAKGLLLRNKLGEERLAVQSAPLDPQGYGLHAMAGRDGKRINVLLFACSPSIFYSDAAELNYPSVDVLIQDLPADFKNKSLKIVEWYSTPEDSTYQKILGQDKYQTLPLTRGADRYDKEFMPDDVNALNRIPVSTRTVQANGNTLKLSTTLDAYGMKLIQIELKEP